jgi:hypothetical protein
MLCLPLPRARWSPLAFVLLLACADEPTAPEPSASEEELAAAAAKEEKEKAKRNQRSYARPERPADEPERADIMLICTALASCSREGCDPDAYAGRVNRAGAKTSWGKLMVEHLAGADTHRGCRRMIKMLREENLTSLSSDCSYLVNHCG